MPKGETSRPMNKDERSYPKGKSSFNSKPTREDVRNSQKWSQDLTSNLGGTILNMIGQKPQKVTKPDPIDRMKRAMDAQFFKHKITENE